MWARGRASDSPSCHLLEESRTPRAQRPLLLSHLSTPFTVPGRETQAGGLEITQACVLLHPKYHPFRLEVTPTFHLNVNVEIPLMLSDTPTSFNTKILYLKVFESLLLPTPLPLLSLFFPLMRDAP